MNEMPKRIPVDFIPVSRAYLDRETGATSGLIADLALQRGRVTLNQAYSGRVEEIMQGDTIFKEITIAPPVIPESIQNLIKYGSPSVKNDASKIAGAIASVIERRWDPKKFHVVMHSSGYDSRIVSKTIANLRDKYGNSWLGEVLFLCWEPEGPEFKEIMRFEGWGKEQYHVCYEGVQPDEYYADVLDFTNCWKYTNDAQPPLWVIGPAVKYLQKSGVITKPITETQLIAAGGGNECFKFSPERLIEIFYYSRWGETTNLIPYSEQIRPFLSWDVIRLIKCFYSYPRWRRMFPRVLRLVKLNVPVNLRIKILDYLGPGLSKMRKAIDDGPATPYRQLSPRLLNKCREDFTTSGYYQQFILPYKPDYDRDMPKHLWTEDWWGEYAKASLCEYLVKNGVKIS